MYLRYKHLSTQKIDFFRYFFSVFYRTYLWHHFNTSAAASHVGIYIGDGQFIHASSGKGCVVISNLWSNYYANHYLGARRIY